MRLLFGVAMVVLGVACSNQGQVRPDKIQPDPLNKSGFQQLIRKGDSMLAQGDYTRAEQYFNAALGKGANPKKVMPKLLRACISASRYNSALQYAQPYLRNHPSDWKLRQLVATLHITRNDPEQAQQELEKVVTQAPSQAMPRYLLAVIYRDYFQDEDKAKQNFAHYVRLAPQGVHLEEAKSEVERLNSQRPEKIETKAGAKEQPRRARPVPLQQEQGGGA